MMSQAVEEFYNKCHSPGTGRFCGGVRGDTGGNPNKRDAKILGIQKQQKEYKRTAPSRANSGPTKDGSEPLGRKFRITGDKKKDTLDLLRLDRGSPARKAASAAFEKAYGNGDGKKPGQSGGVGGGSAGKAGKPLASKPNPVAKAKRTLHNRTTKDGSEPLGRKFKITGNKVKDHLDLLRLDRGSPERKEASRLWNKRYG